MTDEEWEALSGNFESHQLLDAVDQLDALRDVLNDAANRQPPAIRTELLELHALALAVFGQGHRDRVPELFARAEDFDVQLGNLMIALEKIQSTTDELLALRPDSLDDIDPAILQAFDHMPPSSA